MVEDVHLGKFFELATSNKRYVNSFNFHENKIEILKDYTSDFELNGLLITGHVEHETTSRFKNMDDFEKFINARNC